MMDVYAGLRVQSLSTDAASSPAPHMLRAVARGSTPLQGKPPDESLKARR
jgi:hypothetical protein